MEFVRTESGPARRMEPDMIRRTPATYARQRAACVACLTLLLVTACGGSGDDDERADSSGAVVEKYVPEVDEGLGASIAIVIDHSGSMKETAKGDEDAKYVVAHRALEAILAATDSFVASHPDFPVNVGLYRFSSRVTQLAPVARFDREKLHDALDAMDEPDGGTAIGTAMDSARAGLYRAGTFRKYILVITDGENTNGRSPRRVAQEINRRSEGAVRMYFVAFDIDANRFAFLRDVGGEVVGASNGAALREQLDEIYRGKILTEALDAGETLPTGADSARTAAPRPTTPK